MITPKNIIRHELIGLPVTIKQSSNKSNIGISGKVINETKNLLVIKTKKGEKRIQKKKSNFMFTVKNKKIIVEGNYLVAKPEDRVKKKVKKW